MADLVAAAAELKKKRRRIENNFDTEIHPKNEWVASGLISTQIHHLVCSLQSHPQTALPQTRAGRAPSGRGEPLLQEAHRPRLGLHDRGRCLTSLVQLSWRHARVLDCHVLQVSFHRIVYSRLKPSSSVAVIRNPHPEKSKWGPPKLTTALFNYVTCVITCSGTNSFRPCGATQLTGSWSKRMQTKFFTIWSRETGQRWTHM